MVNDYTKEEEMRQLLILELIGLKQNLYADSHMYCLAVQMLNEVKVQRTDIRKIIDKYEELWNVFGACPIEELFI